MESSSVLSRAAATSPICTRSRGEPSTTKRINRLTQDGESAQPHQTHGRRTEKTSRGPLASGKSRLGRRQMIPSENAISYSPREQRTVERVVHGANTTSSPRELVRTCLIRPVNNKSMTRSPRELVEAEIAPLVVRPVNTLKALPGGARFLFAFPYRFNAVAYALRCSRFQGSRTTSAPLHRLHPSNMSQIAPFDLAGGDDPYCRPPGPHGTRALHTPDRHGAHPLRPDHPVHDVHHLRPIQNHTTRNA